MLLNDVGTLLIAEQFQMSLYDGCRPVYSTTSKSFFYAQSATSSFFFYK